MVKYDNWLPYDVGRIKDEACGIVADIDLMGYRGGCPRTRGRCWTRRPRARDRRRIQGTRGRCRIGSQLCPNFQRLLQESSEGVATAIGPRIDCEYHALATVAGRSVRSLLTMYPNGARLKRKGQKREWGYLKETAYAVDSQLSHGEAAATSTKCNRDTMWCRDAFRKKNTLIVKNMTHNPVSNPPGKGVHGWAKLD